MEGRRGHLEFYTFCKRFVYRWHLNMQGMKTWPKVLKYRRRYQKLYSIGMFEFQKCDVNPQPYTRGIGPLVGRTSRYRRSVMHVLAVILSETCYLFFNCQNIFIRVIWSGRKICPLSMDPSIYLVS